MSYEQDINTLLARLQSGIDGDMKRSSILQLMNRLGCQTNWSTRGLEVVQPEAVDEPFVRQTLVQCLERFTEDLSLHYQDGWALLDGLAKNNRWRDALLTLSGSYAMVYLATTVAQEYGDVYKSARGSTYFERRQNLLSIREPFCAMLNAWLQPPKPFKEVPGAETLIRAVFGDFWFELALADRTDIAILWPSAIRNLRPPFLDGITPLAQPAAAPRTLPLLDIA